MVRDRTLPIRVSQAELDIFVEMARREELPVGTFIRRRILLEAKQQASGRTKSASPQRQTVFATYVPETKKAKRATEDYESDFDAIAAQTLKKMGKL